MYEIQSTSAFDKSLAKLIRGGRFSRTEADIAISILASGKKLPIKYRDHALKGKFEGYRECHIRGDILLVYRIEEDVLVLVLANIGSHSYLFG